MKNMKHLFAGFVVGVVLAIAPSCGGTKPCNSTTCAAGCCDAKGECQAGTSNGACGQLGGTCQICQIAQACSLGTCAQTNGNGGGSNTGGGGTTGGGTGGGTTGGGTGGGATGGGTGACTVAAQNCPNVGESCMYIANGTTNCFPGVCDVVTQNCPTTTDRCTYVGLQDGGVVRACVPAGTKAEGVACTTDDCAKGLVCVGGVCAKYCYQTSNCTGQGQCISSVTIPGTAEVPLTCVTLASCDPLLQNCPTQTDGCYLTSGGPSCLPGGTAAIGASCTMANCVKGAICLGNQSVASCHAYCNRDGGMPACASGACGAVTNGAGVVQPFGACP